MWFPFVLGILALLIAVLLFCVHPGRRFAGADAFTAYRYAHRGLHDAEKAENSLSAFRAAVEAGFGIELDTRLSADGVVVVCHDTTLSRVAGIDRRVDEMTAAELKAVSLCQTGEGVPTFAEVLSLVAGRVPILVEIKEDTIADRDVTPATLALLKEYNGAFLIESFNPMSLARVRKERPDVFRGLLCDRFTASRCYRKPLYALLQRFLFNFFARPQFLAYRNTAKTYLPFRLLRGFFRLPSFAWTVKSAADEEACRRAGFDTVIFEDYLPER